MNMFMMYACIVNNITKLNHSNLIPSNVQSRGHNLRFNQPHARTDTQLFTFFLAIHWALAIKLWNKLSSSVVQAGSLKTFKQ